MKGLASNWTTALMRLNVGRARHSMQGEESGGEW